MKKILFITAFLLMSNIYGQKEDNYNQTLRTMFELSGAEESYKTMISQMFQMWKEQYSNVPPEIWIEFEMEFQYKSMNEITTMLSPVYKKYLTEQDLEEVIKFYRTPVGLKFSKKTPLILQESMQIGQEWGRKIGKEFIERMKDKGYDKT